MKSSSLNNEPKWIPKYRLKDLSEDAFCGSIAGLLSGIAVAPFEYSKDPNIPPSQRWNAIFNKPNLVKTAASIPVFSALFACVCALEFSVNERAKSQFGPQAGIMASAITGATFLTTADHFMLLKHRKGLNFQTSFDFFRARSPRYVLTGFSPMIFREAVFILSVMYLGPQLGQILKNSSQDANSTDPDTNIKWNSTGRFITGLGTTLISQPFDSLARMFQFHLLETGEKLTWQGAIQKAWHDADFVQNNRKIRNYPLFKGATPRMALATFGGVTAGALYDKAKDMLKKYTKE